MDSSQQSLPQPQVNVQDILAQVAATAQNPPTPNPTPPVSQQLPPPTNRSAEFDAHYIIATDLMATYKNIATSAPNAGQLGALDGNLAELRTSRDELQSEIDELENQANTDSSPFVEDAPSFTGIKRERIFTLQDYILFILVASYGFAFFTLFFLIGKRTEWNRKILGYTAGGGVLVTLLFYILLKKFA